jgi:predicted dehydrogenase
MAHKADVVLVGCGLPGRGMGWYHALQMVEGQIKSANLTDIVEPWFLGGGKDSAGGRAFAALVKEWEPRGVKFHLSLKTVPAPLGGVPKVALISGRTADNPRLLQEVIDAGCTCVYLEKPGAPSVHELEEMTAYARSKNVPVFMGYNKNVTTYVTDAIAAEAAAGPGASTSFYHNNAYKKEELPECFERNSEGMLKNMAVHELAVLVTYYGVTGDNIADVVVDQEYSSCQTLTGPSKGGSYTDFDAIGFTLTTTEGKSVSVYADRCGDVGGGGYSEAIVKNASGREVARTMTPDKALQSIVAAKQAAHPDWMPYFHLQHDDYVTLKERVCSAMLSGTVPEGVATLFIATETLKVAEYLKGTLAEKLSQPPRARL